MSKGMSNMSTPDPKPETDPGGDPPPVTDPDDEVTEVEEDEADPEPDPA
jgi:hypothetical protein